LPLGSSLAYIYHARLNDKQTSDITQLCPDRGKIKLADKQHQIYSPCSAHTLNDRQANTAFISGHCTVKPDMLSDMSVDVCCKTYSLQ